MAGRRRWRPFVRLRPSPVAHETRRGPDVFKHAAAVVLLGLAVMARSLVNTVVWPRRHLSHDLEPVLRVVCQLNHSLFCCLCGLMPRSNDASMEVRSQLVGQREARKALPESIRRSVRQQHESTLAGTRRRTGSLLCVAMRISSAWCCTAMNGVKQTEKKRNAVMSVLR
eukprot:SAG11_NODE_1031_length_6111_cov_2.587159_8_plen_169_part_00